MPFDDVQLLIATRRGDQTAARALWHAHAPRLVAYARTIVRARGTAHDAEDIVQSAFCRIMDLPERELAAVRDVGPWLVQIIRNTALNWLRAHRRDAARRNRSAANASPRTPASSDAALADAVDALPTRLREIVVLKHIGGLTFDQIELATGINRNTAATRYRSAISLLRESLASASPIPPSAAKSASRQHLVHHD